MSTVSGLGLAPSSLDPSKFKKEPGETVLFKGDLSYAFDGAAAEGFLEQTKVG